MSANIFCIDCKDIEKNIEGEVIKKYEAYSNFVTSMKSKYKDKDIFLNLFCDKNNIIHYLVDLVIIDANGKTNIEIHEIVKSVLKRNGFCHDINTIIINSNSKDKVPSYVKLSTTITLYEDIIDSCNLKFRL